MGQVPQAGAPRSTSRPRTGAAVRRLRPSLFSAVAAGMVVGVVGWIAGSHPVAAWAWGLTTAVALVPAFVEVIRDLARRETGVDMIAVLAMAGALLLGEYFAGAVIALMLTGGEALESYAAGRARRDLSALLERAPRIAHRTVGDRVEDVPVDEVVAGDSLLVKTGEVIPVDGLVVDDRGVLDESALTGESRPVEVTGGAPVRSGTVNAGGPLRIRASTTADMSTYAGIVRLVRQAADDKAPFVRMADRYALWFLFVTLGFAALAWGLSGSPTRALAVLVVATPCPLILAAPAAIVAGISRAARHGIIVKGGSALEALAGAEAILLDKTGTITAGRPRLAHLAAFGSLPAEEVLRLAASLDQVSLHPFAPAIVQAARARGELLSLPTDVTEALGSGISGIVDGRRVEVGRLEWIERTSTGRVERPATVRRVERRVAVEGSSAVFVAVDGALTGALILEDPIRPEAARVVRSLRRDGVNTVTMLTGDHPDVAEIIGDLAGVDRVLADRTPEDKVAAVLASRATARTLMVGDGINDAPALAAADIGVAMGARGTSAASEAADVVLASDRIAGVHTAIDIAKRTRRIAAQSAIAGIGLSAVAMVVAALGYLPPAAGAVVQEVIDLGVLLNALRALRGTGAVRRTTQRIDLIHRMLEEHDHLRPGIETVGILADQLDDLEPGEALTRLERLQRFLEDELMPHEQAEEVEVFPLLAGAYGEEDPTGMMASTHAEMARLVRLYARLVDHLPPEGPDQADLPDLRRALYGLQAVLRLHFAQEDDHYLELTGAGAASRPS